MSSQLNELAHRISLLKGSQTSADIAAGAKVSRETVRKVERGLTIKLSTIKKIADYLEATEQQWAEIVIAWFKLESHPHHKLIQMSYAGSAKLKDSASEASQIASLAGQLDESERQQIILALTRPEVRRSLFAINSLYDNIKRGGKGGK